MIVRLLILACLLVVPRWALALDIQSVKSDSGIEIWLVENHVNPIVSVAFGFKGGSGYDPVGKEGIAQLASGLLDEGAGDVDSQTFQKRMTDRGIELSFSAGLDDFTGRTRFLRDDRGGSGGTAAPGAQRAALRPRAGRAHPQFVPDRHRRGGERSQQALPAARWKR